MKRLAHLLAREWRHLAAVNASNRPWQMPLAAALASGVPLLLGAATGRLAAGIAASLGGLVFLHLPGTALAHRMAWLMACSFGLIGSYALGLLAHLVPSLVIPLLALDALLATLVCRFYAVPPPGSLFFVMAAAIGAYTPPGAGGLPAQLGLLALGTLLACTIAFVYSLRVDHPASPVPVPRRDFDFVVVDSVVIGAFVGLSLAIAQVLSLPRPYWVPVSCLAVIQGASLRAVWTRQLQRIAGTAVGLVLFWLLATWMPLTAWTIAAAVTLLTLVVESLVVRQYAIAVVFITPMALLLAEGAQLGDLLPAGLVRARLVDTVLGCVVGFAGGACLHAPGFRTRIAALLRRLLPIGRTV